MNCQTLNAIEPTAAAQIFPKQFALCNSWCNATIVGGEHFQCTKAANFPDTLTITQTLHSHFPTIVSVTDCVLYACHHAINSKNVIMCVVVFGLMV